MEGSVEWAARGYFRGGGATPVAHTNPQGAMACDVQCPFGGGSTWVNFVPYPPETAQQ